MVAREKAPLVDQLAGLVEKYERKIAELEKRNAALAGLLSLKSRSGDSRQQTR